VIKMSQLIQDSSASRPRENSFSIQPFPQVNSTQEAKRTSDVELTTMIVKQKLRGERGGRESSSSFNLSAIPIESIPSSPSLKRKVSDKIHTEMVNTSSDEYNRKYMEDDLNRLRVEISQKTRKGNVVNKDDIEPDFFRICGVDISYVKLVVGEVIKSPGGGFGDYQVDEVMTNKRGMQIVVLKPLKQGDPPVFCCRGTVIEDKEAWYQHRIDDTGRAGKIKGIGQYGFEISKEEIKRKLASMAQKYGPVVITGHSLGGALAQIITANFVGERRRNASGKYWQDGNKKSQSVIKKVYLFSSPGAGKEMAKLYKSKKDQLIKMGERTPVVTSARHAEDLSCYIGGPHIEIDYKLKIECKVSDLGKAHTMAAKHDDEKLLLQLFDKTLKGTVRIKKKDRTQPEGIKLKYRIFRVIVESFRTGFIMWLFLKKWKKQAEVLTLGKIKALNIGSRLFRSSQIRVPK